MNLPNRLTLARVILVPFFIAAYMAGHFALSLVIFLAASITDFFDGKIARERNLVTNFGKIMDPLADKVLVYSALCLFIESTVIQAWMLIIILAREFIVSGMRTVAASEGRVLAAGMSGKIKTVLQMAAVCLYLLWLAMSNSGAASETEIIVKIIADVVFYASLVMTVYSGAEYVIKNKDVFSM